MSHTKQAKIHVFGGTSDAVTLCQLLDQNNIHYSLSVATTTGEALASSVKGTIVTGRMTAEQMQQWLTQQHIELVIDATHPFATEASHNIMQACQSIVIDYLRFERPDESDRLGESLIIHVDSIHQACLQTRQFGDRVLLTTGSKHLAEYMALLTNKHVIVRVLPTIDVLEYCYKLGLGVANIIAMKGPFSTELNMALFRTYQPDVVITKQSGQAGGFQQKVDACLALKIPCVVIKRPKVNYLSKVSSLEEVIHYITSQYT